MSPELDYARTAFPLLHCIGRSYPARVYNPPRTRSTATDTAYAGFLGKTRLHGGRRYLHLLTGNNKKTSPIPTTSSYLKKFF